MWRGKEGGNGGEAGQGGEGRGRRRRGKGACPEPRGQATSSLDSSTGPFFMSLGKRNVLRLQMPPQATRYSSFCPKKAYSRKSESAALPPKVLCGQPASQSVVVKTGATGPSPLDSRDAGSTQARRRHMPIAPALALVRQSVKKAVKEAPSVSPSQRPGRPGRRQSHA